MRANFQSFAKPLLCLLLLFSLFISVSAVEAGDVDDWQDIRGWMAAFGVLFVLNCEDPGLFNNEEEPIMTTWVLCMILLGFWTVYGICQ